MRDQRVTIIDNFDKREKNIESQECESLRANEAVSSLPTQEKYKAHETRWSSKDNDQASEIWSSQREEKYHKVPGLLESQQKKKQKQDEAACSQSEASFKDSLTIIERRLKERRRVGSRQEGKGTSICIFRLPHNLSGLNQKAQQPELVSIGPYHWGKDHLLEFEEEKWTMLDNFLSRGTALGKDLSFYLQEMRALEVCTRKCYSDNVLMSSHDFVEMMLLDGCFIIELLRHLDRIDNVKEDDPVFTRSWLVPVLIRDILKLENQIPFFVLESLFLGSENRNSETLTKLVLHFFNTACSSGQLATHSHTQFLMGNHLLDMFRLSLLPSFPFGYINDRERYRPSVKSIQCVTQLRPSGIKFKSRESDSFLNISFRKQVLEIPSITINDFTTTALINCVALEQCCGHSPRYFTDYVSFMNCLINEPRDVALLRVDGIITNFSYEYRCVAYFFNNLGKNVAFNIQDCYLSRQFREVEAYYNSKWATIMRTYFSLPWSFISVSITFLVLGLNIVQILI